MTDTTDLTELAKRYIDLWQDHLGDLAADGEVAETIARTIELMSGSASTIAAFNMQMAEAALKQNASPGRYSDGQPPPTTDPMDEEPKSDGGQTDPNSGKRANQSASSGAAAAASAHGGANVDVDELTRRIAELEKRLGQMESKVGRTSRRTAKKPTKR